MSAPAVDRRPAVLAEKCSTCIFRPGNPMRLAPGRVRDMVNTSIAEGGSITCHQTLTYGAHPDAGEAMCRGFYDSVGERTNIVRVVHRLGGYREVPPPVDVDHVNTRDEHDVKATVSNAPAIVREGRDIDPAYVEVGFDRVDAGEWRTRFVLVVGYSDPVVAGIDTRVQLDVRFPAHDRAAWPAWLARFVDDHTPGGDR